MEFIAGVKNGYQFKNETICKLSNIMDGITDNMLCAPRMQVEKHKLYMLIGENFNSISHTLITIDFCICNHFYADAFSLLRKVRDDAMQYLFLDYLLINTSEHNEDINKIINAWINGNLDEESFRRVRKNYFDTSRYKNNLSSYDNNVKELFNLYLNEIWIKTDRTLNNHMHSNGKKYIEKNYTFEERPSNQSDFINTLIDVMIIVLSILIIIDSVQLRSPDYIDALDCGIQPIEDSQYWVYPIVYDFLDQYIGQNNTELLEFLEVHNSHHMYLKKSDYN